MLKETQGSLVYQQVLCIGELLIANQVGAIVCTKVGAIAALPTLILGTDRNHQALAA
ncbi:hypothetical protein [Paenibacillus sp. RS8]|uniref:hypothetical protein n=1 Tax=unclassified Paenibacillus TaxID=185978 RepID=UPI0035C0D2C3